MLVKAVVILAVTLVVIGGGRAAGGAEAGAFSYDNYADVLKTYVNDKGLVDYKGLKAHRERLDAFVKELAAVDAKAFGTWSEKARIAFWCNAYNALTLESIINNYPIQSSWTRSLLYPKNSIRQISGVWDTVKHNVMGRELTLDDIEHKILRVEFKEPRIHMALVCASMSCAPLRAEPYTEGALGGQLDDQARRFMANPIKCKIDTAERIVYISPYFKWFPEDFEAAYVADARFAAFGEREKAALEFISKYVGDADRAFLEKGDYEVKYLDYDWSLNEQTSSAN